MSKAAPDGRTFDCLRGIRVAMAVKTIKPSGKEGFKCKGMMVATCKPRVTNLEPKQ